MATEQLCVCVCWWCAIRESDLNWIYHTLSFLSSSFSICLSQVRRWQAFGLLFHSNDTLVGCGSLERKASGRNEQMCRSWLFCSLAACLALLQWQRRRQSVARMSKQLKQQQQQQPQQEKLRRARLAIWFDLQPNVYGWRNARLLSLLSMLFDSLVHIYVCVVIVWLMFFSTFSVLFMESELAS